LLARTLVGRAFIPERECNAFPSSSTLEESQVEGCEYQDNSYIHYQLFPEPVSEEQEIYTEYDGSQQQYVKHDSCRSFHFSPQIKQSHSI
jgi:hypothetical protein